MGAVMNLYCSANAAKNQGEDSNSASVNSVGLKRSGIHTFAHPKKDSWDLQGRGKSQDHAAFSCAIHLGEDRATELEGLVEFLRLNERVLPELASRTIRVS